MKLYNSLTNEKEDFIPNNGNEVKLYTCGPTVYNYAHIGNLRSYIMEDVLEKSLKYCGYKVIRAMNITDIGHLQSDGDTGEDKMLLGAKRENKTVLEIARYYTNAFREDFEKLHLKWPDFVVPATSCVDTYIFMIEKLIKDGYAYFNNGNVYFDTSKLKNYHVFSRQEADDMIVGAREDVSEDTNKRNKQDFVLWFTKSKFENQALKWDSPWGVGYPGWHIECSGISYKYLGERLDIHCGGVDNKFPHHTNEIAQSESFLGHKWCNFWFHVEHLNLKNQKMSKSSGNFLTLSKLEEDGYTPEVYKLLCLQSHYRKSLVFSKEAMDSAEGTYNSILKRIDKLEVTSTTVDHNAVKAYQDEFRKALEDDLNTAKAMTVLFAVLKSPITDGSKVVLLKDFDQVFNLKITEYIDELIAQKSYELSDEDKEYIIGRIHEREDARAKRDYKLADEIKNELDDMGVILVDLPDQTIFNIVVDKWKSKQKKIGTNPAAQ